MNLNALVEIEAIRKLKARYCRLLDTEQWDAWKQVFAVDVVVDASDDVPPGAKQVIHGREEFVEQTRRIMSGTISIHLVHEPEIEITSPTTATGIWPMQDRTAFPDGVPSPGPFRLVEGIGYYHETYEKAGGQWVIKTSKLKRIHKAYS